MHSTLAQQRTALRASRQDDPYPQRDSLACPHPARPYTPQAILAPFMASTHGGLAGLPHVGSPSTALADLPRHPYLPYRTAGLSLTATKHFRRSRMRCVRRASSRQTS